MLPVTLHQGVKYTLLNICGVKYSFRHSLSPACVYLATRSVLQIKIKKRWRRIMNWKECSRFEIGACRIRRNANHTAVTSGVKLLSIKVGGWYSCSFPVILQEPHNLTCFIAQQLNYRFRVIVRMRKRLKQRQLIELRDGDPLCLR